MTFEILDVKRGNFGQSQTVFCAVQVVPSHNSGEMYISQDETLSIMEVLSRLSVIATVVKEVILPYGMLGLTRVVHKSAEWAHARP